jgi:hypothetical protein
MINGIKQSRAFLLFSILFIFATESLWPCSVCIGGFTQEKLDAYFIITVLLSATPLILSGLVFYYYYKKSKKDAN